MRAERTTGAGAADFLRPGEAQLLEVEGCAVLDGVEPALPAAAGDGAVPSLGVADLLAAGGPAVGRAAAVRLVVTGQRLLAAAADGVVAAWPLGRDLAVVHSDSEPCSLVAEPGRPPAVVVLPPPEAPVFRAVLTEAHHAAARRPPLATTVPGEAGGEDDAEPRPVRAAPGAGDVAFRATARLGGLSVLAIMATVGLFLATRAVSALRATGLSFLTTAEWQPDTGHFGIAALLTGTVLIAGVAVVVSLPLALGTALFISEVAPRRLRRTLVSLVDLMAAVPSIVYGLWGLFFLQPRVVGVARWLSTWFGWIPLFRVDGADPTNPLAPRTVFTASTFVAGLVVALMVVPISCSIMREVFSRAPEGEREAAYALGATRWGMIRAVVLPFGRGGMIGGVMLGLGRALGETIAVYLLISPLFAINLHILQSGSNSVAALIALRQGDASGFGLSALMAAGLALFVLTLGVNFSAAALVARSRSGALSEA